MPKPRALAALVPLLLLTACGTEGGAGSGSGTLSPDLPVTGTHWRIDAVTADGSRSAAPPGARLDFGENGRAEGNSGCNHFGATVAAHGDTLTVTPREITRIGCPADQERFEKALFKALGGPLKGTIADARFTLASADGRDGLEMTTELGAPLRGTTWKIDGLLAGDTASSLPAGSEAKARFVIGEDGRVTGNLGCNNFSASARVEGKTLRIEGPAATTRMMCTSPQMRLETKLYELLDGPLTYRLDHRTLTLTDTRGEGLTATAEKTAGQSPAAQ
ncbi:META domain-containing protein [Streptomyces sp. P9-A4]|uniref:META domain-containing protein n=1 Tax=Streptomyces sp. P9-A4 TaxID=3072285 RepID=UPI002FCC992F